MNSSNNFNMLEKESICVHACVPVCMCVCVLVHMHVEVKRQPEVVFPSGIFYFVF